MLNSPIYREKTRKFGLGTFLWGFQHMSNDTKMGSVESFEAENNYKKVDFLCDILLQSSFRYVEAYVSVNKRIPLEVEGFDQKLMEIRQYALLLGVPYPFRVIRISLDTVLFMASLRLERENNARSQNNQLDNNNMNNNNNA